MTSLVGQKAADFELKDVGDVTHRLADFLGGWLLMVFHRHLA